MENKDGRSNVPAGGVRATDVPPRAAARPARRTASLPAIYWRPVPVVLYAFSILYLFEPIYVFRTPEEATESLARVVSPIGGKIHTKSTEPGSINQSLGVKPFLEI